ncbi:unnamed protein product [Soboliphyme baturini]|uniref:dolichol kinase n=1 Tax=Soboliphyme baturini TaxID=241478 RepID=A0A183JAD1_9BILA|nr:unnamed protein product [Soboliphyme baturini]
MLICFISLVFIISVAFTFFASFLWVPLCLRLLRCFRGSFTFGEVNMLLNYVFIVLLKFAFKVTVLLFWALCVACSVAFAISASEISGVTTIHRKYFHVTISLVLLSGLLYCPVLTFVCSTVTLCVLLIVELIRSLQISSIGFQLCCVYSKFLDQQDSGIIVLTPIYLLIGIFIPIWLDIPMNVSGFRQIKHPIATHRKYIVHFWYIFILSHYCFLFTPSSTYQLFTVLLIKTPCS